MKKKIIVSLFVLLACSIFINANLPIGYSKNLDQRISTGSTFQTVTLSDVTTVSFVSDDGKTKFCRGFHANASGDLKITGAYSGVVTLNVVQGSYYPYAVSLFWSTGSDAGLDGNIVAIR